MQTFQFDRMLSVGDVGGLWSHRLKILETNYCTSLFVAQRPSAILPVEHGKILWRLQGERRPCWAWLYSPTWEALILCKAHRAAIFVIAQISCYYYERRYDCTSSSCRTSWCWRRSILHGRAPEHQQWTYDLLETVQAYWLRSVYKDLPHQAWSCRQPADTNSWRPVHRTAQNGMKLTSLLCTY